MRKISERLASLLWSKKKKKKGYVEDLQYTPITGTQRHCYVHPQNVATHWEQNREDASYKRPVCEGCCA